MGWRKRDDGWFTWWECPHCMGRAFQRTAVCPECGKYVDVDDDGTTKNAAKEVTAKDIVEEIVKKTKAKISIRKGTKGMKQENIYMLQYVAGALHGICTMMSEVDGDLKNVLSSLSEEVSNVVISETIDREDEVKSKVSIYVDDGGDDGK